MYQNIETDRKKKNVVKTVIKNSHQNPGQNLLNLTVQKKTDDKVIQRVNWGGMTAGVEREIGGLQILHESQNMNKKFGEIRDAHGTVLWDITRDMTEESVITEGDEGQMELISTPELITNQAGIQDRQQSFDEFAQYMVENAPLLAPLTDVHQQNKQANPNADITTLIIPAPYLIGEIPPLNGGYTVHDTAHAIHAVFKDQYRLRTNDQITVGATLGGVFAGQLQLPWLDMNYINDAAMLGILQARHITGTAQEPMYRQVFAYIVSLAEKEAEIKTHYEFHGHGEEMIDPGPKNAWEILPRKPKSEILAMLPDLITRRMLELLIRGRIPRISDYFNGRGANEIAAYRTNYRSDCLNDMDAGRFHTVDTIQGEPAFLFEYRSPNNHPSPPGNVHNQYFRHTSFESP